MAAKAAINFDDPAAFDYELLVLHIEQLAAGNSIVCPLYDFATHTRQKAIEHIVPTPDLIVEGLFALYWPLINNLYYLHLFIATDDNLCLKRRVNTEIAKQGNALPNQFKRNISLTCGQCINAISCPQLAKQICCSM